MSEIAHLSEKTSANHEGENYVLAIKENISFVPRKQNDHLQNNIEAGTDVRN